MSLSVAVRRMLAASSILTGPWAPWRSMVPRRPTARNSVAAEVARRWEPAGSRTVISTAPEGPKYWFFAAGAVIRRVSSSWVISIRSAALVSRFLAGSAGRISTVVSVRSAAMIWRRPAGMSMVVVTGAGVWNVCIRCSCAGRCFR